MVNRNISPTLVNRDDSRLFGTRDEDALFAGMTLILAKAAAAHLQAHEPERAALCVAEAQRCLARLT